MGRQRDPKRNEAKEIYKAAMGEINLTDIAAQLGVSDGTVRGWKAKDKWENLLTGDVIETERSDKSKGTKRNVPIEDDEPDGEQDELFITAVKIVAEAKQASVSLLQRRMRIGYSRAARLMDAMEQKKLVGPYQGDKPREVYATPETVGVLERETPTKRNAPKKQLERSVNSERSKKEQSTPNERIVKIDLEIENDELTDRQRLFCIYYVRIFNATQAAIKAGYSADTAHVQGPRLLGNVRVAEEINRLKKSMMTALFIDAMDVLNKYVAIAFADITDFVDFGQQDVPMVNEDGVVRDTDGSTVMTKQSFVALKNSSEVDGTVIGEVKEGKEGVSVKLLDKMKALEVLTKYFDLLPDKHKRMVEEEKLKLDKERLELDKQKAAGEGDLDEELIDEWVDGVMGDEEDGESIEENVGVQEKDTSLPEESKDIL